MESMISIPQKLERIDDALRASAPEVLDLTADFVAEYPDNIDGWIFRGRALQLTSEFAAMLDAARRTQVLDPANPLGQLLMVQALLANGRAIEAFEAAKVLEAQRKFDAAILGQVGNFYAQTNRHAEAARCYERVKVLLPGDASTVYSLASAYVAMGQLDKAEQLFDALLRKSPHEYDAYYNRATLRKQTAQSNHVAEMEKVLAQPSRKESGEQTLCYSLAKELEDMKDWKRSFEYLRRGADAHRRYFPYDRQYELGTLDTIANIFDEDFFRRPNQGFAAGKPIFVLGMPRSGTTLVDRILSSHRQVESAGESSEFAASILRACGGQDGRGNIAYEQTRTLDFAALGHDYCNTMAGLLPGAPHTLDKTPSNFYVVGLIAAALPNAPIIHLRRNPVANCYAVYKTLFRSGYNFSYNLEEMGEYYLGYLRLMAHWRKVLPGRFLDVDYEALVANQEEESRRLIAWCGLEWEDAVLSFEKNASPSLTASAAQVRQPIYRTSLEQWRNYEEELQPLIRVLRDGGVEID